MANIMLIQHVNVNTILGKSVHVVLLGVAPAFRFKITGVTIATLSGEEQTYINGYDEESLDLSININDIKHIYGG